MSRLELQARMNALKRYRTYRRVIFCFLQLIATGLFVGCDNPRAVVFVDEAAVEEGKVFASPEEAVEIAGGLVREHRWADLAEYYDLTDSEVPAEELEKGTFFHAPRTEAMEHPSGVMRYRHPFPPGYRFLQTEPTDRGDTVKVIVLLEIDQGIDVPQRSLAAFLMRKPAGGSGWKILSDAVEP